MKMKKMKTITTIFSDNNSTTCLICNTTYKKGKPIIPFPKCECGNISFFDITEHYVRFAFNWWQVKVRSKKTWREEILNQILKNGKPDFVVDFKDEEERLDFDLYLLMQESDRNDTVSKKEVMEILKKVK